MIRPRPVSGAAVEHGIKFEQVAVACFESQCGLKTSAAGLFINLEVPYFAASPDRIIDDNQLVEVKCPFSARDQMITPSTVPYLEMCDQVLSLKKNHDYFYQIQGQLLCANRNVCHFVVYTFKDMKVIKIARDDVFIATMKKQLKAFFVKHFRDVYLDKMFYMSYYDFEFSY